MCWNSQIRHGRYIVVIINSWESQSIISGDNFPRCVFVRRFHKARCSWGGAVQLSGERIRVVCVWLSSEESKVCATADKDDQNWHRIIDFSLFLADSVLCCWIPHYRTHRAVQWQWPRRSSSAVSDLLLQNRKCVNSETFRDIICGWRGTKNAIVGRVCLGTQRDADDGARKGKMALKVKFMFCCSSSVNGVEWIEKGWKGWEAAPAAALLLLLLLLLGKVNVLNCGLGISCDDGRMFI